MRKRPILILLTVCAVLALLPLAFPTPDPEPTYQGKSLSQWLYFLPGSCFQDVPPASAEAREAVRIIGTNAIPTIVHWISYEPSRFRAKLMRMPQLRRLPDWLQRRIRYTDYAGEAELAFAILGPAARPAVPELVRLAIRSSSQLRAYRYTTALTDIGPDALPGLLAVATNTQATLAYTRYCAILSLYTFEAKAPQIVPALLTLLSDEQDAPALAATEVLGYFAIWPRTVVPALTHCMQSPDPARRASAAAALGRYATEAIAAAPQIRAALLDPDQQVRRNATNAIRWIAPEALTNASAQ